MAKWFRPFSILAAKTYKRPEAKVGPHWPLRSSTKYLTRNPENTHESILDFTARFGEIKPDMLYLCRRGLSGLKRAVFTFFPSVRRESMKKNVKSLIFRKKTSKLLSSLPFKP